MRPAAVWYQPSPGCTEYVRLDHLTYHLAAQGARRIRRPAELRLLLRVGLVLGRLDERGDESVAPGVPPSRSEA